MDWALLKDINNNYATVIGLIISFVFNIIMVIINNNNRKEKHISSHAKNKWFSINEKYHILAVHKLEKSNDPSGYKHISQNSRPEQWKKLIQIKRKNIFWLYIEPVDPTDILEVVISRNGKEPGKVIEFNKK